MAEPRADSSTAQLLLPALATPQGMKVSQRTPTTASVHPTHLMNMGECKEPFPRERNHKDEAPMPISAMEGKCSRRSVTRDERDNLEQQAQTKPRI